MALTLEQVAGYLPFKPKGMYASELYEILGASFKERIAFKVKYYNQTRDYGGSIKLLLKPMSELSNDKLRNDMILINHWSHIDWTTIERDGLIKKYGREKWINDIPYVIVKYLYENHYDFQDLIGQGLAIDSTKI